MGLLAGFSAGAAPYPTPSLDANDKPLKAHVQRFLDSSETANYRVPFNTYRTLFRTKYSGSNDTFYMIVGNGIWRYQASDLLTGGRSMVRSSRPDGTPELYLEPGDRYDQSQAGSGWPGTADTNYLLEDFDFDGRGYVYLGYTAFGWGILQDNGGFTYIWREQGASSSSQQCTANCPPASMVIAATDGSNHYALIGGPATWGVWNVNTPSSPVFLRSINVGARITRDDSGTWLALTDQSANVRLVRTSDFVQGNTQGTSIPLAGQIVASSWDGEGFWFAPYSGTTFFKVIPGNPPVVKSYPVTGTTVNFLWIAAGADYVAGGDGSYIRTYSVGSSGLQELTNVTAFTNEFYPVAGETFHKHILPFTKNGKKYFIWSAKALGDVYEVQGGDSLGVTRNTAASPGTTNPNAPANTSGNPFYGDLVTFNATFNGTTTPSAIKWSPDYPSTAFGSSVALASPFTVRYTGSATVTKKVRAEDVLRPEVFGEASVTVQLPKARVKAPGVSTAVESSQSVGKVLTGATFFDASDGVVEGHVSDWSLDDGTVATSQSPLTGFGAGGCGARTLTFTAKYDGYTAPALSLSYAVQPVIAKAAIGTSDATSITFLNQSTYGTGFQVNPVWTETWELLDASNTVVRSQASVPLPLGTVSPFAVLKSEISTGYKVRLRMSVDVDLVPTGCDSNLSDESVIPLTKPDPNIVTTLCQSATTLPGSCTLSVASLSGASTAGWSYIWFLNGTQIASTPTYTPSFAAASTYTITVRATNPFGDAEDSESIVVSTPPCSGPPNQALISFSATPLGGRTFQFDAAAFGYSFQTCDQFSWTFGDGNSGSGRSVQHTYAADNTYSVTLVVSNTLGTATVVKPHTVGAVTPPPPPATCDDPRGKVFVNFAGATSGCGPGLGKPACHVGETVTFSIDALPGFSFSCHTQTWNFGTGASPATSTARTAQVVFSSATTRTVNLTVSNGSLQSSTTATVKTETPTCGTTAPSGLTINYSGLTSGCFPGSSVPCKEGEQFRFSIKQTTYQLTGCETASWNLDDGSANRTTKDPFFHTFTGTKSVYNVALSVTNTHGTTTDVAQVRFFDPSVPKPVVSITPVSKKAKVGSTVDFTGSFQTGETHPLVAINWRIIRTTFGDEVVHTANNVGNIAYTFNEIGDYRVELTATNAGGVSTPAVALVNVAEVQEFAYLIPVVAHLPGSNGTQWRTDLQIFNTDPLMGPVEFEFQFKGGVAPITKTIIMSSSTVIYEDFLGELSKPFPSLEDAGPVLVLARGDSPPQMWTRTYTVDSSGIGSYGQLIPAISLDAAQETEAQTVTYVLPGLEISDRFRTNIGIVNPNAQAVSVNVMARDDSALGFPVGSFDVQVAPFALLQIGDLTSRLPGIEIGAPFSLNIRTLGNAPVVVYGSMIDQLSNDPVYITGVRDVDQEGDGKKVQIIPGAGRLEQSNGTWRSDIVIYNDDLLPIRFDLQYFDTSGTKRAEALNQPLGPGAFVRVLDVLKWEKLDTDPGDSFGMIKIRTNETVNRYPIVFERTYKDRGELGSFGQGIPAISPDEANVKVGQAAFLAGVRSDESYYTNLGLVAVGDQPSTVRVTLLHDGSGAAVGTWEYTVGGQPAAINPNASLIVTNIIRAISPLATRGTLKIEVVSGGDVWAYASVIAAADPTCGCSRDEHTFDPEYIPAVRMPIP